MKQALELLIALRALCPALIGSLTLDKEEGMTLIVGLCDQSGPTFKSFQLDAADLARAPEDVAREIAGMASAKVGAS